jgi:hypothetical protein
MLFIYRFLLSIMIMLFSLTFITMMIKYFKFLILSSC